jgi:DNA-binding transcriptional ArsR family regulator
MQPVLDAIAEPRRREILRLISHQEMPVGEIASHFDISRPAVSQHLRVLRLAGLIHERQLGTRHLYLARPEALEELKAFLDEFWSDALTRLAVAAEAEQQRREEPRI